MKATIPTATNAIFNEINTDGDIKYDTTENDRPRPDEEHGYVSTNSGDSGSPYWMEDENGATTLIAINHGNVKIKKENKAWYGNDPSWQCRTIGTKITEEIKEWIAEKEKKELGSKNR